MQTVKTSFLLLIAGALLILSSSVYVLHEGQRGFVIKLGKIVTESDSDLPQVNKPGLHFKLPLITQVKKMDVRVQTLDVQASRIPTREQNFLVVDYFAKWAIDDLALFYTRTRGSISRAEALLQQQINDDIRAEFSNRPWLKVISQDRGNIMELLEARAKDSAKKLGIDVIDVRIKQIELPATINEAVYERMRKRRLIKAQENRSTGQAEALKTRAEGDKDAKIAKANALAKAADIRAEGIRQAAKIYADAYSQDLEFYTYYQSLTDYKTIFSQNKDMIVLDPDNQFFQYFKKSDKANS